MRNLDIVLWLFMLVGIVGTSMAPTVMADLGSTSTTADSFSCQGEEGVLEVCQSPDCVWLIIMGEPGPKHCI